MEERGGSACRGWPLPKTKILMSKYFLPRNHTALPGSLIWMPECKVTLNSGSPVIGPQAIDPIYELDPEIGSDKLLGILGHWS